MVHLAPAPAFARRIPPALPRAPRALLALVALVALLALAPPAACAQGLLIPEDAPDGAAGPAARPAFATRRHRVTVDVRDQVARTHIEQTFVNLSDRESEATYHFPVPLGAALGGFRMRAGGKPVATRLYPKDEARRIYESIVARRRDPALLECLGRTLIQARVFPIPAHGEQKIEIDYDEILPADAGLCRYSYPLSLERLSARPLEEVAIAVRIEAAGALKNIYSPSHTIALHRHGEHRADVSYEECRTLPEQDFVLYFGVADGPLGVHLLTWADGGGDGWFLLLAAPPTAPGEDAIVPKDVAFVLDTSGSMAGEKLEQARHSLAYCINSLRPQDRFTVVAFNTAITPFDEKLVAATPARIGDALAFVRRLTAAGGTNIDEALGSALAALAPGAGGTRPAFVLFLTDGLPTVGEQNPAAIVKHVAAANAASARVFTFGVGDDVNAHLLDQVAAQSRGVSEYVRPQEDIEIKVSAFFAKVGAPVLTEVKLEIAGVRAYDVYPKALPDLFVGTQLVLCGRYAGSGRGTLRLGGRTAAGTREFVAEAGFPQAGGGEEALPRLWAARKIGYLLDEIRLHGKAKELVDEVIELSRRFGIITEYTSFLIEEDGLASAAALRESAERRIAEAFEQQTGGWAVAQAQNARANAEQSCTGNMNWIIQADGSVRRVSGVRRIDGRTFYRRGGAWVDAAVNGTLPVEEVAAFSPEYFELNRSDEGVARIQALGQEVLYVKDGKVVHCR
ncbi:MAG: VWA domain-containing protein [Planctomycetes bacterium]|nr:VWA domain-containing protein [Planctomycetota bacterium]